MFNPILRAAAPLLALAVLSAPVSAASVIVNGTFDNNTTGWTGSYSTRIADPWIDTGSYYFPGAGPTHSISQDYALSTEERAKTQTGRLGYAFSADMFGWHGQRDYSILSVSFFDSANTLMGFAALDTRDIYPDTGMPWDLFIYAGGKYYQELTGFLPTGTTLLRFAIDSVRVGGGTNNDGYIDNASFVLTDMPAPAPVPLPATLPLLAAGVVGMGALRRRKTR
ncbi:hypothetical protein PARHAE_00531 [Paracoccus haematequi]|uniref:PEP-CTERM protein-sorting domain-containing protein n=1 Tax=Paracoccus haematequi TaxID=2491866 RepID=A0A447IIL3_9RHOB|nr:hypothetical protein [Paracoccus haematequi]VDS07355.1 hypothetical protein PARHAE_00531 [Paracoccus haematequi]